MRRHSQSVLLALSLAEAEARAAGCNLIEPAHLLLALCKLCDLQPAALPAQLTPVWPGLEPEVNALRAVFHQGGVDVTRVRRQLRAALGRGKGPPSKEILHRSPAAREVFACAEAQAGKRNTPVTPLQLLAALLEAQPAPWDNLFAELGVQAAVLARLARQELPPDEPPPVPAEAGAQKPGTHADQKDRPARAPGKSSVLETYGRDLTRLAADGKLERVIGRRGEMRQLAQVLMQKRKSNAILVGDPGVGKTGIVEGLAQRIVGANPPAGLKGRRIVEITMASLVAGAKLRGDFEERLQAIIKEATANPNLVLFIDEIHTMMGAGGEGSSNAANILKPALARGDLRCIGATTTAEYRQYIEKDAAIERRFQVVWVEESTRDEALEILAGVKPKLEQHHSVAIAPEALPAAVDLSIRYLPGFRLPDKAIDLLDQACARARMPTLSVGPGGQPGGASAEIGAAEVAEVVAQRCRIPVDRLTQDEARRFLEMEDHLRRRVIGQQEAVRAVAETVRTSRAGLRNPKRPIGAFLFAGSSGTGKTELAKALAEFLYDDAKRLLRFDMSEYMEQHAVARLIGSPPGYIGHDEEGQLTGAVRSHPASVVLFDEIEKAHPRVLDLFLQIFDEATLTDSRGRKARFNEAVIILTSNLGSATASPPAPRRPIGFRPGSVTTVVKGPAPELYRQQILAAIHQALRPELVNRLDRIVCFQPLSEADVRRIIDKILGAVCARLAGRRIGLRLTDEVYDSLMEAGYRPEYGAREMERAVERLIVQPLGKALLEGRFHEGDELEARLDAGAITFERKST